MAAASPATAAGQAPAADPRVGRRPIAQYGTVLRVGGQVDDEEGRGNNPAPGKDSVESRIDRVERVDGPWLGLAAEGSGVKGRARAAYVIPFDQAIDHITTPIRANPGDATKYNRWADVWKARQEPDIAVADLNEAIRLDPGYAAAYVGRGIAWSAKKDYDRAIADHAEAIRLDPGYAIASNNRAWLWAICPDASHRHPRRRVRRGGRPRRRGEVAGGGDRDADRPRGEGRLRHPPGAVQGEGAVS
jgi:hypothetical protein